jgi:hypothetical protein
MMDIGKLALPLAIASIIAVVVLIALAFVP